MRDNLPVESYLNMMHTYYQRELGTEATSAQIQDRQQTQYFHLYDIIRC